MIEESGLLLREGGGFVLKRDTGGTLLLRLGRTPVDLVGKRVRIVGETGDGGVVDVQAIRAD